MTTELNVNEFKKVLATVKPAVSNKDLIPIFSYFCFEGDKVTGFGEPIGIEVQFNSGINGGIKGDTLLSWVNALPESGKISYETSEGKVKFKSGKSKLELSLLPTTDFIHEKASESEVVATVQISDNFINAIESCLLSVTPDSDNPSMAGITISKNEETVFFNSTNGLAISEYTLPIDSLNGEFADVIILPAQFCNVLKKLYKEVSATEVFANFTKNTVSVVFDGSRKVELWSKLLDTSKTTPLDFEAEISGALNGFDLGSCFEVTDTLITTMSRLLSVYSTSTNEAKLVQMSSNGKELALKVKKANIEIDENVEVDVKQAKISAVIDLEKLLHALLPGCGMAMLPNLALVSNDQFTYLQAYKHE